MSGNRHEHHQSPGLSPEIIEASAALARGGVLIYPTETLYALGASALNVPALDRIGGIKQRPPDKPLPVLIGMLEQLHELTARDTPEQRALIRQFWPGPLSILVPARPGLPRAIQNKDGYMAVRWTPHPVAQALAAHSGHALAATSANFAGRPPADHPRDLDQKLVQAVDTLVFSPPYPAGGLPSTLVRIVSSGRLQILRHGAVSLDRLCKAGWHPLNA